MDSELILDGRGAIYHLGIKPDELAETVIFVGDPDRVGKVSERFDHIEFKHAHREFITHTGHVGAKRISVISTGIGPDNIDIVLNELDALCNLDLDSGYPLHRLKRLSIIRLGTSGSLQPDLLPGEMLLSRYAVGMDNMIRFYPDFTTYLPLETALVSQKIFPLEINPYSVECSEALAARFSGLKQGITITAPGFYAPQGRKLRGGSIFNDEFWAKAAQFNMDGYALTNFEMETSAIYGLAKVLHHDAVSISMILANRPRRQFLNDPDAAVERMLDECISLIQ
jgi:uridine phosphorylase